MDNAETLSKGAEINTDVSEKRLYVISRSGSGEVHYLVLTPGDDDFANHQVVSTEWTQTEGLTEFGVTCLNNNIYIIGGYDINTSKYQDRVYR